MAPPWYASGIRDGGHRNREAVSVRDRPELSIDVLSAHVSFEDAGPGEGATPSCRHSIGRIADARLGVRPNTSRCGAVAPTDG